MVQCPLSTQVVHSVLRVLVYQWTLQHPEDQLVPCHHHCLLDLRDLPLRGYPLVPADPGCLGTRGIPSYLVVRLGRLGLVVL